MNRASALALCFLMVSALFVNVFSGTINETFEAPTNNTGDSDNLVGLQSVENWPVLRVSFPGKEFPNEVNQAFFEGEYSAQNYIEQISGGRSSLDVTFIDGVWESPYPESHWGTDSNQERDVGSDSGGARQLAADAITSLMSDTTLSKWDLDGDMQIDRILILHSGEAQELGGTSTSIWSHFSTFTEPPIVNGYKFEHYTMASVNGGIGVVVHEMLHQMGAVDLYDVHSDSPTKSWHGLGDWDVMSSGNWIDDGNTPSLPSTTTLDLIGAVNPYMIDELDPNNPGSGIQGDIGQHDFSEDWSPGGGLSATFTLKPISDGGSPLRIWIAPGEYLWITLRVRDGFDIGIPGEGIIVEHQDWNNGDFEGNMVNTDPSKAWARIVEADGDDALLRARDYGSSGDAFRDGDSFGSSGHRIWDNAGRLVGFSVNVTNMSESNATIEYHYPYRSFILETPRNPIVILPGEVEYMTATFYDGPCNFTIDLDDAATSSEYYVTPNEGNEWPVQITFPITHEEISPNGGVSGNIGCDGQEPHQISLNWITIKHRISEDQLSSRIKWDSSSDILLYPKSLGTGEMTYSASITGAADRIANVPSQIRFQPGEPIEVHIEPDDLLEPGMIARGEIVLVSSNNIEYRIPIVLQAEGQYPILDRLSWLSVPSNAITVILVMLAISFATGNRDQS